MSLLFFACVLFVIWVLKLHKLVSIPWTPEAQEKIDTARKERRFWHLVKGYNGMSFDIQWIFNIYLEPRHLSTFMTSMHKEPEDVLAREQKIKGLLTKRGNENDIIRRLNLEILDKENTIKGILDTYVFSYTQEELSNEFAEYGKMHFTGEQYKKLTALYLSFLPTINTAPWTEKEIDNFELLEKILPKESMTYSSEELRGGINLWDARKELEEKMGELEFDTAGEQLPLGLLYSVKQADLQIGEIVRTLLCKCIPNIEVSEKLKNSLTDWSHLHLLRWCLVDFSVGWIGTNSIHRFFWRAIS